MTGITYIKNPNGENTHIVLDLGLYGKALEDFLEELEDIQTIKATENEATISLVDVRKDLIARGASEDQLAVISEDV